MNVLGFLPHLFVFLETPALGLRASKVVLCQGANPGARSPGTAIFSVAYSTCPPEITGWSVAPGCRGES